MEAPSSLSELLRPGALQLRLGRLLRDSDRTPAVAQLYYRGESASAVVGSYDLLPVGCIAKLLTASLATLAVELGYFTIDSDVSDLLAVSGNLTTLLSGVTVKQLLEHTHGLDDSLLRRAPTDAHGRIDLDVLSAELNAKRLASPGRFYSYGPVGAWLMAAVLEKSLNCSFAQLLQDRLFSPLGISLRTSGIQDSPGADRPCPALGGGLAISTSDMLKFLQHHLTGADPWCFGRANPAELTAQTLALPGWSPLECGTRLGWKHYGLGWYGHNSVLPRAPALVRCHTDHRIAFVVAATEHSPASITGALFGPLLPQFVPLQMPKLLSEAQAACLDTTPYVGVYQNAAATLSIVRTDSGALQLRAYRFDGGATRPSPFLESRLRPARDHLFFLQPAEPRLLPFIQFVCPGSVSFQYLWNGTSVWPRIESGIDRGG